MVHNRDFLGETHVGREGAVWHPLSRAAWGGLLEHAVNLLKRQSLGFGDEEDRVDEAAETEGAPDEENLGSEVGFLLTNHVGGDDCDDL